MMGAYECDNSISPLSILFLGHLERTLIGEGGEAPPISVLRLSRLHPT